MQDTGRNLTPKQERGIAALLAHPTIEAAAEALGVNPVTIHRWLAEPAFDAAYRAARHGAVKQSIAQLQQASGKAVAALLEIIDTEYTPAPAAVRVSAAKAILDFSLKSLELEDLASRIEALEQAQEDRTA